MDIQNQDHLKNSTSNNVRNIKSSKKKKKSKTKNQLTKDSLEFMRIKEMVLNTDEPDNTEKILKLKKLIAEGQYQVDLDELSEKITRELL